MERIFFQRAPSGFRTVQGELILKVQCKLQDGGLYHSTLDGIYGDKTEHAVLDFQEHSKLPLTGKIDDKTWQNLQC